MIPLKGVLCEIDGPPGSGIHRDRDALRVRALRRVVIPRILPALIGQRAVHISDVAALARFPPVPETDKLRAHGVLMIKPVISPALPADIGTDVGAPRTDADTVIKFHSVVEAPVKHSRAVNTAQTSSDIDDTDFVHIDLHAAFSAASSAFSEQCTSVSRGMVADRIRLLGDPSRPRFVKQTPAFRGEWQRTESAFWVIRPVHDS